MAEGSRTWLVLLGIALGLIVVVGLGSVLGGGPGVYVGLLAGLLAAGVGAYVGRRIGEDA